MKKKQETKKRKQRKDKANRFFRAVELRREFEIKHVSRCQHSSTQNLKFLPKKKMQKNSPTQVG